MRGCDKRVLEFVSLWDVVEHIIRRYKGCTDLLPNTDKLPVALRIPMQKILLKFYVHAVGAVPVHVPSQLRQRFGLPPLLNQTGYKTVASAGKQHGSLGVRWQVCRIKARLAAVKAVRECEQLRHIGVAFTCSGK